MLVQQIVLRKIALRIVEPISIAQDAGLRLADVLSGHSDGNSSIGVTGDLVAVAIRVVIPAFGIGANFGDIRCIIVKTFTVRRDAGIVGSCGSGVAGKDWLEDSVVQSGQSGGAEECFHVGDVLGIEPVEIVVDEIGRATERIPAVVIRIDLAADTHLFLVVKATDPLGANFGAVQGRQENRSEDGDDGNNHEQFDQREGESPGATEFQDHCHGFGPAGFAREEIPVPPGFAVIVMERGFEMRLTCMAACRMLPR